AVLDTDGIVLQAWKRLAIIVAAGAGAAVLGIVLLFAALRRLLAQVAERTALLEGTLANIGQGLSVFDRDLRLVARNERLLELLDLPAALARPGCSLADIVRYNAERGEYGTGSVADHLAQRVALVRTPHRFVRTRPDGTVLEIRGMPSPEGFVVTT